MSTLKVSQIGLGVGVDYGTAGQVLTSNGSSSAATWEDVVTLSTAVTLSSDTSVTFTDVPSWAGKIIVMLGDVDTSTSQHLRVRLGTSGGVINTGYVQSTHNDGGGGSNSNTDAFYWFNNDSNAGFGGLMTITKLSSTEYCQAHAGRFTNNGGNHGGGYLSGVSGTIDRVEISIVSGNMTSGRINLRYEP
jgi:hypothetical protein